jgi:hypothetical protein
MDQYRLRQYTPFISHYIDNCSTEYHAINYDYVHNYLDTHLQDLYQRKIEMAIIDAFLSWPCVFQ